MRKRLDFKSNPCSVTEAVKKLNMQLRNQNQVQDQVRNQVRNQVQDQAAQRTDQMTQENDHGESYAHLINYDVQKRLKYLSHALRVEHTKEYGEEYDNYDGKLQSPVLAQQDAGYGFSASQLNSYARCPFTYFAQRILDLEAEDESLQELLDTGTFYHAVLEAYQRDNPNPRVPDIERLDTVFNGLCREMNLASATPLLMDLIREEMRVVLHDFIIHDSGNME